jgi:FlaA1/EpsC-like NDP-sugar epimerase
MLNPGTLRYDRFLSQAGEDDAGSWFASAVAGQTVLVTGAGGYIGSALVKAIAAARSTRIVLLDSCEHNLFQIRQCLEAVHARVPHEAILGSVTDASLLDSLFTSFRPGIVYHAAALKLLAADLDESLAVEHSDQTAICIEVIQAGLQQLRA